MEIEKRKNEIIMILKARIYNLYLFFSFEYKEIVLCCFLEFLSIFI